jgi:hypothetical protein
MCILGTAIPESDGIAGNSFQFLLDSIQGIPELVGIDSGGGTDSGMFNIAE